MAARARTRPRTTRSTKGRRSRSFFRRNNPFLRPEVIGIAIAALAIAVLPWLIDIGEVGRETRDWFVSTFGLGIFIVAGLSAIGGVAIARRSYADRELFARRTAGAIALGIFAWGALGLNDAAWTVGGVNFQEVSVGGDVGRLIVSGFLGKVFWLGTLAAGMWLVAPGASRWLITNVPLWFSLAWEHRVPHRAAAGTWRFIRFIFRRPDDEAEEEVVIGGTLRERLQPRQIPSFEEEPAYFRRTGEGGEPASALGTGAAAAFGQVVEEVATAPKEAQEAPEEPEGEEATGEQLGLELDTGSGWALPPLELLNAPQVSVSRKHDNAARAQLIMDTLASFGVDATVAEVNEGPTVTQFGVEPGWEVRYKEQALRDEAGKPLYDREGRPRVERIEVGRTRVRVNKITALQNDLALALAAPSLRIEAPVPGRAIVGIEVPNDSASVVTMRNVMETKEFAELVKKSKLALPLGKGVSGTAVVADLAKMPHLLIAGATGSGKSVCMNAIIGGIMMNASPDHVRFVMIDPKRVELTPYSPIPHLAFSEVIVDIDKVVGTLQAVVREMEARYKKFAALAVRNIEGYNKHPRILKKLPYWVVVIDELADLMMAAPFEVEKLLCRLAQLARATGIHLVVATQRPSVDVVTGLIKANFPTRIAFSMTSQTDSRTILDVGGAEKLLGRGDMLFMPTDAAKPIRIQGVYVSDAEVERLVQYWTDARFATVERENADALLEEALREQNGGDEDMDVDEDDPAYDQARELAMQHQRVSPSLFQRRLRIGYLKATKIMELLEEDGIVGPREEGESRRVLASVEGLD